MNGDVLDILRYWYIANRASPAAVADAGTGTLYGTIPWDPQLVDGNAVQSTQHTVTTPADIDAATSQTGGLLAAAAVAGAPDNVVWARAMFTSGGDQCAMGVLETGAFVLFAALFPPAGLAATTASWVMGGITIGSTLASCFGDWLNNVGSDARSRWYINCSNAYLTADDYQLNGDVVTDNVVSAVKFEQCLVWSWAATQVVAHGGDYTFPGSGIATSTTQYVCAVDAFSFVHCWWY